MADTADLGIPFSIEFQLPQEVFFIVKTEKDSNAYGGKLLVIWIDGDFYDMPVYVNVTGDSLNSFAIYPNSSSSDPSTKRAALDLSSQPLNLKSDSYYWMRIYPLKGPYYEVIIRLKQIPA